MARSFLHDVSQKECGKSRANRREHEGIPIDAQRLQYLMYLKEKTVQYNRCETSTGSNEYGDNDQEKTLVHAREEAPQNKAWV
jgi:hypothetical protein